MSPTPQDSQLEPPGSHPRQTRAEHTQAPGFYRFRVGRRLVTAVCDGTIDLDMTHLMTSINPTQLQAQLDANFVGPTIETSVNTYLVETEDKLVLIDTGCGQFFGPTAGHFLTNLHLAGYSPNDVDLVLLTHLHSDHAGGLITNGDITFQKATTFLAAQNDEIDYWLNDANRTGAPDKADFFDAAQRVLTPYLQRNRVQRLDTTSPTPSGITILPATGHTVGHCGYLVHEPEQTLLIWGDIVHCHEVQFAVPSAGVSFDTNGEAAQRARSRTFNHASSNRYLIAGAHLPFPGIGHIRSDKAFDYLPANYTAL